MFGTKIKSVESRVIDYGEFKDKNGNEIITSGENRVKTYIVTVNGEKYCTRLPFVLRYLLMDIKPIKRMMLKEIDVVTTDIKILVSSLIMRISKVDIDSKCDADSFRLKLTHNDANHYDPNTGRSYIYVNTKHIEFLKKGKVMSERYINDMDLCHLEFGRSIEFQGLIEEQNSYSTNSIFKFITNCFPTKLTDGHNDVLPYYDGSFTMRYTDNVDGKGVMKWAIQMLLDIIDAASDFDNSVDVLNGKYCLTITKDRNSVISNFIDAYILMSSHPTVYTVSHVSVSKETKMLFDDVTRDTLIVLLTKTFDNIKKELNNLLKDL